MRLWRAFLISVRQVQKMQAEIGVGEDEQLSILSAGWTRPLALKPAAVEIHERDTGHIVRPRLDYQRQVRLILDLPLPRIVDCRPWRCQTCKHQKVHKQFPVTFVDIDRLLKEKLRLSLLLHKPTEERHAPLLMTKKFLLYSMRKFYANWNGRDLRRDLAHMYSYNAAAFLTSPRADWRLQALPFADALRDMALVAFRTILPHEVAAMQLELLPYSGGIVRGDGNYKIAKKLRQSLRERRPWNCIVAWCGTDGAVLAPPDRLASEDFEDLKDSLLPLLQNIRSSRLQAGLDLVESAPVAHCTDRFAGHRFKIADLYAQDCWLISFILLLILIHTFSGALSLASIGPAWISYPMNAIFCPNLAS